MDLGVFQENKFTKGIYTQEYSGYRVVASEMPTPHSDRFSVLYRAEEHLSVEAIQLYGANVIIFQLASGGRRWFIVG